MSDAMPPTRSTRRTGRSRRRAVGSLLAVGAAIALTLTSCTPSNHENEQMATASLLRRLGRTGMTSNQVECSINEPVTTLAGNTYYGICATPYENVEVQSFYYKSSHRATTPGGGTADAVVTARAVRTYGGGHWVALTCWYDYTTAGWATTECGSVVVS